MGCPSMSIINFNTIWIGSIHTQTLSIVCVLDYDGTTTTTTTTITIITLKQQHFFAFIHFLLFSIWDRKYHSSPNMKRAENKKTEYTTITSNTTKTNEKKQNQTSTWTKLVAHNKMMFDYAKQVLNKIWFYVN